MRTALAPVNTGVGETAAQSSSGCDVYAKRFERLRSFGSEVTGVVRNIVRSVVRSVVRNTGRQPSQFLEAIVKRDAEGSGDMIVASSSGAQGVRSIRNERGAGAAGKHAQCFECRRHVRAVKAVVAVLSLSQDLYQMLRFQTLQVNAGS